MRVNGTTNTVEFLKFTIKQMCTMISYTQHQTTYRIMGMTNEHYAAIWMKSLHKRVYYENINKIIN